MGPQISAGTECSNTFFQPLMLLTFLTPSTPLWKVQAITDRRTAVTCPIMGDVRMPGAAFASLLHWSMRVFHKATNEISAENRCWFAYSLSILKMMQAQKTMAPCLLWNTGNAIIKSCEGCMCERTVYELTSVFGIPVITVQTVFSKGL